MKDAIDAVLSDYKVNTKQISLATNSGTQLDMQIITSSLRDEIAGTG